MADDKVPEASGAWNPNEALSRLRMEMALDEKGSPQAVAKRLFEESLPMAVMSITHIAMHGESEVMRFNASKYVVERTMGPAERVMAPEGRHAWDDIYEKVVSEAEGFLNSDK